MSQPVTALVIMGVAGCGKTSVSEALCRLNGATAIEGDSFHPAANIEKMSAGHPLNDDDRAGWLDALGDHLASCKNIVLACSALKKIYREHLRAATGGRLAFVYLDGSRELLGRRMGARTGHFMPLGLLDSQLATLEVPTGEPAVVTVSIDQPVEGIVAGALKGLGIDA